MALKKRYYPVNGEILGEEPVGGARVDYAIDALGSVTGTLAGGALQNTYFYKPLGSLLQKSGGGIDPTFRWVGAKGYKTTDRGYAEVYVRARAYSLATGRWSSCDPLQSKPHGPQLPKAPLKLYVYSDQNPTTRSDPSGLKVQNKVSPGDRWEGHVDPVRLLDFTEVLDGCTGCDIVSGGVWRWAQYLGESPTARAILTCTWEHEGIHTQQYTGCCSAMGDAYRALKPVEIGGWIEQILWYMFYGWTDSSNAFFDEAAAYAKSADCYNDYLVGCESSPEADFCENMTFHRDRHNERAIRNRQLSHGYIYLDCPLPSAKKLPTQGGVV